MRYGKIMALLLSALLLGGCGGAASGETGARSLPAEENGSADFRMELLSTGKSDCALLCLDGLTLLSDAADRDDLPAILALLKSRGVEKLDYLVLSHFDKDHIGAAAGVLDSLPVGEILSPDYEEQSEEYFALTQAAAEHAVPWSRLTEERRIETEHGSILLDPPDKDYGDDNNNSLVMVLTWREQRLVFLGDAEKQRMKEFRDFAEARGLYDLPWVFVKLPHHGDSCKALLQVLRTVRPLWAAETVSAFESVEPELLDALAQTGTELFLTRSGAVSILWDGERLTARQG